MDGTEHAGATLVARRRDLLWRHADAEVLVLRPDSDHLVVLQGTAIELWELLAARRSIDDLIGALAARHRTTRTDIEQDVHAAIEDLHAKGLVQAATPS